MDTNRVRIRAAGIAVIGWLAIALASSARAEEGAAGHYMPGAMGSVVDALPGRSTIAVASFFTYYDADGGPSRSLPFGGLLAANVDATAYAETILGLYQTPFRLLGGDYAVAIAIPYVWLEVEGSVTTPGLLPGTGTTRRVRDTTDGIGDITLYPFMLGWTALGGDLKYDVRLGIYAPTGDYDVGQLANAGKNYWSFEPGLMVSYLSSKIGTELSGYFGADFNTENDDTDYQSGEVVHFDGTLQQHLPLGPGFPGLGVTGFVYEQVGEDGGSGARLGSFEGSVRGVGPIASYALKLGGHDLVAELKWIHELGAEKRLEGDYVWFKLAFAL